jgi:hypothetical protein
MGTFIFRIHSWNSRECPVTSLGGLGLVRGWLAGVEARVGS